MRKRSFWLDSLIICLVASLHVVSFAAILLSSKREETTLYVGSESIVLSMHQINIAGDAKVNAAEESLATDEKPSEELPTELVEINKEEPEPDFNKVDVKSDTDLIAAKEKNTDMQIEEKREDFPKKEKKIEKKPVVVKKAKPPVPPKIVKTPQSPQKKNVANGSQNSRASTAGGGKPLISDIAIVKSPSPHYPRSARLRKESGKVVILMEFNEKGIPVSVKIERSSGFAALDESAVKAARGVRSKPYYLEGRPIAFRHRMVYEFNLT